MKILFILLFTLLSGCTTLMIDNSISEYQKVKNQISLGDSKEKVLSLLEPIQPQMSRYSKGIESYMQGNEVIEIFYARSLRQADGLTTDDEFTPYTFKDGTLVAVGWASMGNVKTQGQARDVNNTTINNSTTIID